MTKNEQRLSGVLQQELAQAEGADQNAVAANRKDALDYYNGKSPQLPPDLKGGAAMQETSTAISMDVADMTNAVLAQLAPMLSTEAMVTFEPTSKEDEEQARMESEAVNNVIIEQNRGYTEFQSSIKDALLLRNGCVKIYVDDDVTTRDIPIANMRDEEIAVLVQPKAPNELRTLHKHVVRVTTTRRRFKMASVPLDNVSYEANANTRSVQELRFFSERLLYKRSDLVEMGHSKKKVADLPRITENPNNSVSEARNFSYQPTNVANSPDQDVIECFECYIRIDLNEDGVSELYKVLMAGRSASIVLEYEEVDLVPYALGTGFIQPHRILGESLYDHLKATQDTKTSLLRNMLDNQRRITYGSWVADPSTASFDDILSNAAVIRSKNGAVPPQHIAIPDIGGSIQQALEYQDKVRSERGGAALDMLSADAQIVGETATGIERQYAQRELMTSFMGRNLAETLIRPAYMLMHEFMRRHSNEPLMVKMSGNWTEVDPSQWPRREACDVKAGMSAGERTHIQRTLQQLLQMQVSAVQQGLNGQLADVGTIYNTVVDWCSYAGLDNPDSYVINPKSQEAQQAAQASAQAAQQQQQALQQQQAMQTQLVQQQVQLEQMKLAQAAKEANDEIAYKYWSDRLKAETDEAKTVTNATVDLEKIHLTGEQRERAAINGASRGGNGTEGVTG